IPSGDLTQEDVSEDIGRELEFGAYARNVVRGNDCAEDGGNVQDLGFGLRQLLVGHRTVTGTEVERAGKNLADSATGTDGLIVDLNVGVEFVVLAEPLGVDRIREGRT